MALVELLGRWSNLPIENGDFRSQCDCHDQRVHQSCSNGWFFHNPNCEVAALRRTVQRNTISDENGELAKALLDVSTRSSFQGCEIWPPKLGRSLYSTKPMWLNWQSAMFFSLLSMLKTLFLRRLKWSRLPRNHSACAKYVSNIKIYPLVNLQKAMEITTFNR